jgi:DNA-binding response OmpR family regulator
MVPELIFLLPIQHLKYAIISIHMPKKIFILEDESFYAKILTTKFQIDGYEVKVFENGQHLLESVDQESPDLLIIDLLTPIMDGFQTLEELQKRESLKDIPKIVLSNLSQPEDVKRTKELGAIDHLVKTEMSIHELVEKIKIHVQ